MAAPSSPSSPAFPSRKSNRTSGVQTARVRTNLFVGPIALKLGARRPLVAAPIVLWRAGGIADRYHWWKVGSLSGTCQFSRRFRSLQCTVAESDVGGAGRTCGASTNAPISQPAP